MDGLNLYNLGWICVVPLVPLCIIPLFLLLNKSRGGTNTVKRTIIIGAACYVLYGLLGVIRWFASTNMGQFTVPVCGTCGCAGVPVALGVYFGLKFLANMLNKPRLSERAGLIAVLAGGFVGLLSVGTQLIAFVVIMTSR